MESSSAFFYWYNKSCWFPMKKCWCQKNWRRVIWFIYFWSSLGRIIVQSFITLGFMWQILIRYTFLVPNLWGAPKRPILNRVKDSRGILNFTCHSFDKCIKRFSRFNQTLRNFYCSVVTYMLDTFYIFK